MMKKYYFLTFGILIALLSQSCSQYFSQPLRITEARLGSETPEHKELISLPPPSQPVVAAVYKFRDQTGQYKPSIAGSNFSTAVTQGATSILLRALEESEWFVPIEREALSNLINERKIISSSRQAFGDNTPLPALLFAGILLEGGIISYDSNVLTGGVGARYFGTGASGQYRVDRVTIYLRAISTQSGRILKTVYTSKMVMSQQVDVGIFRFVSFQKLLEAETGFTYNEPGEMAVKEAIEKAVVGLIVEGVKDNLWGLQNAGDINSDVFQNYEQEKSETDLVDVFGTKIKPRRGRLGLGAQATALNYVGDFGGSTLFPGAELNVEYGAQWPISMNLNFGYGRLGTSSFYQGEIAFVEFAGNYRFFNNARTTPFVRFGLGATTDVSSNQDDQIQPFDRVIPHLMGEIGLEYLITDWMGLSGSFTYRYLFTDELDNQVGGRYNDYFWGIKGGLNFYLFR